MLKSLSSNCLPCQQYSNVEVRDLPPELSISGSSPSSLSGSSSDKLHLPDGDVSVQSDTATSKRLVSHGSISVVGRRRQMEDTMTVAHQLATASYDFFAVYDGFGGARVSEMYRDRMHLMLANEVRAWTRGGDLDWEKVMSSCFEKMDEEANGGRDVGKDGSTAVVVVLEMAVIVVGKFGDSGAVLFRGGVAVPLPDDRKHDRSDEMDRVKAAGGNSTNGSGSQVVGAHADSRSIGAQFTKQCVISQPKVTVYKRMESDHFIILASDGLWGVLSKDFACDVVRKCLAGNFSKRYFEETDANTSREAATMLAELAIARGSKDNITVIVVELNKLDV